MGDGKEWYSNRDLFEQITHLRDEMRETRSMIKQYNGLREEVGKARDEINQVKEELETLQAKAMGRSSVWKGIRDWGGWIVAVLGLILAAASKLF